MSQDVISTSQDGSVNLEIVCRSGLRYRAQLIYLRIFLFPFDEDSCGQMD